MTPTTSIAKSRPTAAITRAAATALITAALAAATDIGFEAAVAVTDASGFLRAFERADSAPFLTVEVAINKAYTAVSFNMPTHFWPGAFADPNVAQLAHTPRLVAVGGGYPIFENGLLVGGIGISGGSALQDQQAAEKALQALGFDAPG